MDETGEFWHYPDMRDEIGPNDSVPAWHLYGEDRAFPDVLHVERIADRAPELEWVIAPHRHPHLHQFLLIRSGGVEITADGRRFTPKLPCLISIPRGMVHGFAFMSGTDGFVLTIPLQSLPDLFEGASPMAAALGMLGVTGADDEISDAFDRLHAEYRGRALGRTLMLKARATALACDIVRHATPPAGQDGALSDPRFRRFDELVRVHFRDGWTVDDYARALGLSARHLGRLCRQATGQTAFEHLESTLMREACRLLVYTRGSIASVGYQLGFEDPSYFSRAFRRHTGLTPRSYRDAFERE